MTNQNSKIDKRIEMNEQVILVDEKDQEIGTMEKMEAHEKGVLHRAFSVVIINEKGEILLQQRSLKKYHSGGLWSNTCCGHPRPGEEVKEAAKRRLKEEMNFGCILKELFHTTYNVRLDHELSEHEYTHILVGKMEISDIYPDPAEVIDWKWTDKKELLHDMKIRPEIYTKWFAGWYERFLEIYK